VADSIRDSIRIRIVTPDSIQMQMANSQVPTYILVHKYVAQFWTYFCPESQDIDLHAITCVI